MWFFSHHLDLYFCPQFCTVHSYGFSLFPHNILCSTFLFFWANKRLHLTRPQFKTYPLTQDQCKPSAVATIQATCTDISYIHTSRCRQKVAHPHFKMCPKITTQVGTQSIVCLSGLELTVKYTQTPVRFFGI